MGPAPRRVALRFSAPVERIAAALVAERPVRCSVEFRRGLRGRRSVELVFAPLDDALVLGEDVHGPNAWLIWQSATAIGAIVPVPCDPGALADRLGLWPYRLEHEPVRRALAEILQEVWRLGMR